MEYCPTHNIVISTDEGGMVEYWSGSRNDYKFPKSVKFESKVETDLYEFAKKKATPLCITVSPNDEFFVTFASDRKIRIFR